MFTYTAHVDRVVDGDTIDVSIDLGFDIWHKTRVRLAGIDAPEHNTELGKVVAQFVKEALTDKWVTLTTYKPDKYGRILADVSVGTDNFNRALIAKGYAVAYDGGKKTPFPMIG
jgi:micrococcal nuclease